MEHVFVKLLNMSIAAGWLILAVVFLRILLKKAPGWLSLLYPVGDCGCAPDLPHFPGKLHKSYSQSQNHQSHGVNPGEGAAYEQQNSAFWVIFAAALACITVAVCFLTNPRRDAYQVRIVIPAGSGQSEISYSEEEISPLGNQIVLSAGEGLGDTKAVLFPMEWEEERTYEPVYMTPGMPVKMDAEKGAWFRIGIYADNPTDEDKVVYVRAEGVDIRIADQAQWAVIPMVMVNDKYYYDTNQESTKTDRSLNMDGEITSSVKGTEKPAKNNQSNFGTGYAYQFGENDTIEIRIDGKWMIFENRSGDGSLIRYGDHWDNAGETPKEADDALKKAISNAILKENESSYLSSYNIPCCDFLLLGTETSGEAPGEGETQTITCYGWALYQEYMISENGIEDMGGSHIPVALTFEQFGDIYVLKEYWKPRDGSYFEADIRSRFKPEIAKDAMDSQKFILGQIQNCYKKVIEATEFDTDRVVERLLDAICGSPAASSNPRDYVQEHSLEYRELLCYGEYTLRYCLNRFQKGQETGLEGKIMALVCEELLQTKGAILEDADTASTGQAWYDALYAHGSSRVEPYLE